MNENYVSENFNNYLNKSMRNVLTYIENPQNEFEKLQNEMPLRGVATYKSPELLLRNHAQTPGRYDLRFSGTWGFRAAPAGQPAAARTPGGGPAC